MPDQYIVFIDNLSGFTEVPTLRGDTLLETVSNIVNSPNSAWFYYIYTLRGGKVPIFGGKVRVDVYQFTKTVAGRSVEPFGYRHKEGFQYALTDWSDTKFLFADKIFE
jgi:hypothetical protein